VVRATSACELNDLSIFVIYEKLEDTKWVIGSRKSKKDRQQHDKTTR
jgi:hypothetical protein